MSKMGSHDPFEYLKHKLWPKERPKVKLAIWLPTTKSQESPRFPCVQVACHIPWKTLNKSYNFALDLTSIRGLHTELWAPKVAGILTLGISGLPLGSLKTKWHLGAIPWPGIEYTIKGKVVASPKSELWWVLWICVCPWLVRAPKVFQLHTNQLIIWFVQVCVSKWLAFQSS